MKKVIQSTIGLSGRPILDSLAVPDNVNPSYYIFNYVGGGYVIMPADKRVEPILSYSNNGYFPHSGNLPSGLVNWLSVNHKNMQLLRKNTTLKVPSGVAKLWAELAAADSGSTKVVNQRIPPPPPCQDIWTNQTIGPLLQTAWAQGYPYNQLCPSGSYSVNHTPTGCVATAMAQVMYYWKTPAKYNWSIMPLISIYPGSYSGNMAVAQLMADLGNYLDMVYNDNGSYPFPLFSYSCSQVLKYNYQYSSSTEGSYNYQSVVNNLNSLEPVLLSASTDNTYILFWPAPVDGHEWVCDGWEQSNYTWCPSNGNPGGSESWLFLDMNWGWNELGQTNVDGFYYYNQWSVYSGSVLENYQYNLAMTYNIHP